MESHLEELTVAETIDLFLEAHSADLHVAMPCKVESFNASKQTVDVVPALNRSLPNGQGDYVTETLPKLSAVPVAFPRGGGFFCSFPLQAGDYGHVIICDRNIAFWRATGQQGDPGDLGAHTLDGAFFVPALAPDSKALSNVDANSMIVGSDTSAASRIVIKSSGEIDLGATASNFVAMADKVKAWFDAFNAAVSGWVPVPNDGGAALKAALGALIGGVPTTNVASSNVKAND